MVTVVGKGLSDSTMLDSIASCANKLNIENSDLEVIFKNKEACSIDECQNVNKAIQTFLGEIPDCTTSVSLRDSYGGLKSLWITSWDTTCPANENNNNRGMRRRHLAESTMECTADQIINAESAFAGLAMNSNIQGCYDEVGVPLIVENKVDSRMCESTKCKEVMEAMEDAVDSLPDCMITTNLKDNYGDIEKEWDALCNGDGKVDVSTGKADESTSPTQRKSLLILWTVFSVTMIGI